MTSWTALPLCHLSGVSPLPHPPNRGVLPSVCFTRVNQAYNFILFQFFVSNIFHNFRTYCKKQSFNDLNLILRYPAQRRKTFADRTPQENALVAAVRSLRDVFLK